MALLQSRSFPKYYSCALIWLVSTLAGCGGGAPEAPTGTASGKVTFKQAPLTSGRVNFVATNGSASAFGDLGSDGVFKITGELPIGEYSVHLTPVGLGDAPPSENPAQDQQTPLDSISKKYQDPATTDLKATVKEGKNDFTIDIPS